MPGFYGMAPIMIEKPFILKMLWFLMLLLPALAIFSGLTYLKGPAVVIALALAGDYLTKREERGGK